MIVKSTARKIRRLYGGRVIIGFAGAVADAFVLSDKFESHLEQSGGQLTRAAVETAKEWRADRTLRRLEAEIIATDGKSILLISGGGEVLEPDDGVLSIGSGSGFALAAARALLRHTELAPVDIVRAALELAAEICVYTNASIVVEEMGDL
jgi:ATP-dependent HslUV protease subunit HslV